MNTQELQNRLNLFAYRVVKLTKALPKEYSSEIIIEQILHFSFSSAACTAQSTINKL